MKNKLHRYIIVIFRLFLAVMFIYSGFEKISNPGAFAQAVENYRLIPFSLINITALIIPWIEFITGCLLLAGIYIKESLFIITIMLVLFTVGVLSALLRGLDIDCGCFGTLDAQKVGMKKIIENIILIVIGMILFVQKDHKFAIKL